MENKVKVYIGKEIPWDCDVERFISESDYDTLLRDFKEVVEMYSPKTKRDCQHNDPSWCNQFCNDYGSLARSMAKKYGIEV